MKSLSNLTASITPVRLPTIVVSAPRCPYCDCRDHKSYRSAANGDGSQTKWTTCKACGQKFIIVLE